MGRIAHHVTSPPTGSYNNHTRRGRREFSRSMRCARVLAHARPCKATAVAPGVAGDGDSPLLEWGSGPDLVKLFGAAGFTRGRHREHEPSRSREDRSTGPGRLTNSNATRPQTGGTESLFLLNSERP